MRIIFLTTIFTLTFFNLFGQEMDSLQKAKMDEMMKEMEIIQKHIQPKEVDNFSNYFKPELIDTFFKYIQQDKYDQLYENSDEILKEIQSKDEFIKYFTAVKNIYGQLKSYEHVTYSIRNQMRSEDKTAKAIYSVDFENAKGKVATAFNVIDSVTIKLTVFQISMDDYTEINEFDKISKSTFDFLISKNYPELYSSTSKRYKDYTPIAKFEEYLSQLKTVDFKEHKLFRNQIGVIQGQLLYYLTFDINNGEGYLNLTYTETNGQFLLEGLNYEPKE